MEVFRFGNTLDLGSGTAPPLGRRASRFFSRKLLTLQRKSRTTLPMKATPPPPSPPAHRGHRGVAVGAPATVPGFVPGISKGIEMAEWIDIWCEIPGAHARKARFEGPNGCVYAEAFVSVNDDGSCCWDVYATRPLGYRPGGPEDETFHLGRRADSVAHAVAEATNWADAWVSWTFARGPCFPWKRV